MSELADRIPIVVNGEPADVDRGWRVADLLSSLNRDPRAVAVEHNGAIVPRAGYESTELRPGDRLEIVQFVQGG